LAVTAEGTDLVLAPADPAWAEAAARLVYDTGRNFFGYLYNRDLPSMFSLLEYQWRQDRGVFSHTLATAALTGGRLVGLELGYDTAQLDEHARATGDHLRSKASASLFAHIRSVYPYISYLIPHIPERAYYIQNLAIVPNERRKGFGRALLEATFEQAARSGYRSCHLDVDSTNPAVKFYLGMGMEILAETRVPALDEPGHVPPHCRMVKALA
jgi:ribosomal protein S18 acetylase RimI-like enzyme